MGERPGGGRLVTAGRVGRPHGLDGSFKVAAAEHGLEAGTAVVVGDAEHRVRARRGTADAPIVTLEGITGREAAAALSGELLLVRETDSPLEEDEWLAEDLIGLDVPGLGTVHRILDGPSCDVLELDNGTLVPLVHDAVAAVDLEAGTIEVDRAFLGLEQPS